MHVWVRDGCLCQDGEQGKIVYLGPPAWWDWHVRLNGEDLPGAVYEADDLAGVVKYVSREFGTRIKHGRVTIELTRKASAPTRPSIVYTVIP